MKIKKILAVCLCVVIVGVMLTGCSGALTYKSLEGTWWLAPEAEIIFKNEVYVYTGYGKIVSGSYEIKGDRVVLRDEKLITFLEFRDVKISGDILTCSLDGSKMTCHRK